MRMTPVDRLTAPDLLAQPLSQDSTNQKKPAEIGMRFVRVDLDGLDDQDHNLHSTVGVSSPHG